MRVGEFVINELIIKNGEVNRIDTSFVETFVTILDLCSILSILHITMR